MGGGFIKRRLVTKSSWVNLNLRHYSLHLQPRNLWSLMLRWNISFFMVWLMHFSIFDDIANSLFVGARADFPFGARSILEIVIKLILKNFMTFLLVHNIQDSVWLDLWCVSITRYQIFKNLRSRWYFLSSLTGSTFSPHFLTWKVSCGLLEKIEKKRFSHASFTVV